MRNGLPSVYWSFRYAWSAVHLAMVGLLVLTVAVWLLKDGNGIELFYTGYYEVQYLSDSLASLVPFPWD